MGRLLLDLCLGKMVRKFAFKPPPASPSYDLTIAEDKPYPICPLSSVLRGYASILTDNPTTLFFQFFCGPCLCIGRAPPAINLSFICMPMLAGRKVAAAIPFAGGVIDKTSPNDDPLFPMTNIAVGKNHRFEACGLKREHWSTSTPIRDIFRKAFNYAGLPYFKPHSFRNTLVQLGQSICQNPEVFKAWSQNLGHESVLTTFRSYGDVARERQAVILKELRPPSQFKQTGKNELADEIGKVLRDYELRDQLTTTC